MPRKPQPVWKQKAKKSDLSPKELEWQERQKEETLRKNFEARQKRLQKMQAGDTTVVPEDVVDWFDRARVALLAATDETPAGSKASSKAPKSEAEQRTRSYISQKFERRGISAFSLLQRVMEADPRAEQGVGHARAILEKELVGRVAVQKVEDEANDGDVKKELKNTALEVEQGMNKGPRMVAPLRVLCVGGGCGAELAGLVWASKYFLKMRPITATTLHPPQDSGKSWKKSRNSLNNFVEQTQLLPPLTNETATVDLALPLRPPAKRGPDGGLVSGKEARGALEDEAMAARRKAEEEEEAERRREREGEGREPGGGLEGEEGAEAPPEGDDGEGSGVPREAEAEAEAEAEEKVSWVNARALEEVGGEGAADLVVLSYCLYESGVAEGDLGFFRELALEAKTEAAFLFIDVQNRSREAFDKVYEAMLAALEAAQPKTVKKPSLSPTKTLESSDAQIQEMLLSLGPSHAAIERMFRVLSLGVHPDKNKDCVEAAELAFLRLQGLKESVLRGHDLVKQEDGSTLIAPLAVHSAPTSSVSEGLLLRFDIPPSENCKAEVMLLVKGPIDLQGPAAPTSSHPLRAKREKGGGQ